MTPTGKTPPAIHLPRTAPLREFVTVSRLRSVFSEFSGGGLPETVDGIVGDEAMLDSRLNEDVAGRLEEIARLLAAQGANPFRARAYHRAAETVRRLPEPVSNILDKQGLEGLQALPGVGEGIARSLRDVLAHGRLAMLERLRGESDPISLLTSVPGIGRTLADRLHHDLGIDTLEDLEAAAHDGRLEQILGFGPKRLAGIRDSLAHRLARVRTPAESRPDSPLSVEELLDVDREYREKARAGRLVRIAPRRFNPSRAAWLPILHTERGPRHYTALFSNTARAHRLGRTGDWVVIYSDGAHGERQFTVITSEFGPLKGRRIVRGREAECDQASPAPHEAVDRAG
jgi:DNA polymerase (family 10)